MKQQLAELIAQALERLRADGVLPADARPEIHLERGRDQTHGDYATNLAMRLAKPARRPPRALAEALVAALPEHPLVARVEVAGPGFINFHLREAAAYQTLREIWEAGDDYGRVRAGAGRRVLVEFVSANPTGPLHVGHGRGAAFGAALASLLDAAGYQVEREYYVNDAGRQMDILAVSVWLRYLEALGEALRFPDNGYRGDYIRSIAATLQARDGDALRRDAAAVQAGLPADAADGGDKERHIDALILRARELLGEAAWRRVHDAALEAMVADIRADLEGFGVAYDRWFSERSLTEGGAVDAALDRLRQAGHLELRDGAEWFLSSRFGDEKDRVVRRADGQPTYFASDIAYHLEKLARGYDTLIDVWGADHHGYVARVKAALQALGEDPERLQIRLVQFAILYRGGKRLQMSTRSGEFVTLRELRSEVGDDAARFFYVMRRPEQHLDFDLDLAKSESADNPVYYLQYAHARVCSVMAALQEKGLAFDAQAGLASLERLTQSHEKELLAALGRFPELVESAAEAREPHQLAHYLRELATAFHSYYNAHPFLVEDAQLRDARLVLVLATRQVIRNGLRILGVSAPESM